MGGGAWPFLVGGVICLVNSVNERDLSLLTSGANGVSAIVLGAFGCWAAPWRINIGVYFLEGLLVFSQRKFEAITGQRCP